MIDKMARLTEEMVIARAKQSDLSAVKKLNCWGSELVDVSLLRRMPNVEVISLSVNKINSLADFAHCAQLRELYIRKNRISDLSELRHLQGLQRLQNLWLDENPCSVGNKCYRMTVLRALPRLEKLDDVVVQPEEVQDAMKKGIPIVDPEDSDGYYDQSNYWQFRGPRSLDSSPERVADAEQDYRRIDQVSDCSDQDVNQYAQQDVPAVRVDAHHQSANLDRRRSYSHDQEDQRFEQQRPHSQYYETSLPPDKTPVEGPPTITPPTITPLRHSQSTHSIKVSSMEYSPPSGRSGGPGSAGAPGHYNSTYSQFPQNNNRLSSEVTSPTNQGEYYERYQQQEPPRCTSDAWERDKRSDRDNGPVNEAAAGANIASALLADYRGFTRRPVTRNSNLLSAVLCLVKELDYPSLEVTEMAVRCRMDELANSQ